MSGLVLAGGASRRMGTDKALLELNGEPMVLRSARILAGVCTEVLVASGDGRRLGHLGVRQVADVLPGAGPLAGIAAGLKAAANPLVAVVAVDMPDADPEIFLRLAGSWAGEPAVVPVVGGRPEPLHAIWARAAAPGLVAFLGGGGRAVTEALSVLGARLMDLDGETAFVTNLNAPGDLP